MITLSVHKLHKSYGVETILNDVTFAIQENEKVGIVGPNGAGKTTLMRIIAGELERDGGDLFWGKGVDFGYLKQNEAIQSDATLWEEVLDVFSDVIALERALRQLEQQIAAHADSAQLESIMDEYARKSQEFDRINGYAYTSEARGILLGLGFTEEDFQKKISTLSGGEQTRLMLSRLLLKKPTVLLLDEPTNHLDTAAVEWLEGYLMQYRGNVLLISHDRYFLDRIASSILEIKNHELTIYPGNYSNYTMQRVLREEQLEKQYKDNQQELQRQKAIIAQLKAFGREKQVRRARSREKLLAKMDHIEKPDSMQRKASIRFTPGVTSGYEVLKVEHLTKRFGARTLFEDFNLEILRGERVALIGPNGVGKTTLFQILRGKDPAYEGSFQTGVNVGGAYFDQTRSDLDLNARILDEVWNAYPKLTETQVRTYLAAFLFTGEDVFKLIGTLSGGERARISLLKLMLSNSNLLFMDEPTNHLDIDSKEVLEHALSIYEGTLFFISHDRYFINALADRVIAFTPDGVREFLGNYDDYQETLQREQEEQARRIEAAQTPQNKTQQRVQYKKEKERGAERRRLKSAVSESEERIARLESEIADLEQALCTEEVYSDPARAQEYANKKTAAEEALESAFLSWETHSHALDAFDAQDPSL